MRKCSEKRLTEISEAVKETGIDGAAKELGLARETVRRIMRHIRNENKPTEPIDNDKAKLLERMSAQYSTADLRAMLNEPFKPSSRATKYDFSGDTILFGVASDWHIGSAYTDDDRISALAQFYKKEGASLLLIPGDLTEGMSGRDGHVYELKHIGYKAQKAAAVKALSQFDYMDVKVISGNHDLWFASKANMGALIVEDICAELDHCEYLGEHEGSVYLNGARADLWHGEDGSCFDDKTEIMTKHGWKFFRDLTKEDHVATMTKETHEFQWQQPRDIFIKEYNGDMVHFKSQTLDCMVTPNHGMWTRVSKAATYKRKENMSMPQKSHCRLNTDWHRKDAGDIHKEYQRQKWQFTKACDSWVGSTPESVAVPYRESKNTGKKVYHFGNVPVEDMAELIAWYVTEGHARKNQVGISQYVSVNPDNHAQIVDLAERLGANYGVSKKEIRIHSRELAEYLKSECGHLSRHKYLPEWLKNCDTEILTLVLNTMIAGDGWIKPGGDTYGYRSISPRLVADFAEIAVKCGYAVAFSKDGESVGIYTAHSTPTVNARPALVPYSGRVYCCEVPNGLIYVRRNGKTLWTHNSYALSYRIQKIVESLEGGSKPQMIFAGHDHKAEYIPNLRNIQAVESGCVQRQTPWMRRKKLAAHEGAWLIEATIKDNEVRRFKAEWIAFYK